MMTSRESELARAGVRFWETLRGTGEPDLSLIDQIAGAALDSDPHVASGATALLFRSLVEPLNDSFALQDRLVYYRIFARVIELCRRSAAGRELDRELERFEISDEQQLLQRSFEIARNRTEPSADDYQQIAVLSRVTPGADVAVTSAAISVLKRRYPLARIAIIGSARLKQLFGGDPRIELLELRYERHGGLLDRFSAWIAAVRAVDDWDRGSLLVVDPDSRISQLGMLPLRQQDRDYLFFNGSAAEQLDPRSLSELISGWLADRIGGGKHGSTVEPFVALEEEQQKLARRIFDQAGLNKRPCVSISFGVGGNAAKRISPEFEQLLVLRMLEQGRAVLLDRGVDPQETANADRLLNSASKRGFAAARIGRDDAVQAGINLLCWDGDMGGFAGLIGLSRRYLGYDSLFQHVAAALGVELVALFKGFPGPTFPRRWRPAGPANVHLVELPAEVDDIGSLILRVEQLIGAV
ncbi:MAG: hypothetical protein P9M14_12800 [Candidatus Alcyoniella australis]|nr:hypothetical protein [Candidatus Alcyoniella australis]